MSKNDKNGDKTSKNAKNPSSHGQKDAQIWQEAMGDVTPLKGKNSYILPKTPKKQTKSTQTTQSTAHTPKKTDIFITKLSENSGNEVDKRNLSRFRSGKMLVEARIDLHSMNQDQAHTALIDFILKSHNTGKRCVLVITGKGDKAPAGTEREEADWLAPERGVLKRRVPDWLHDRPIGHLILQTAPAQPKDGGTGALYVLLRRQR